MKIRKPAERVLSAIMGETWAITQSGYDKLIEIASRENVITSDVMAKIEERKEGVIARKGSVLENTHGVIKRGSVALINVTGPLVRYADIFSEISGATSVDTLAKDFSAALDDPSVRSIILIFDTPGGQIAGINEFATMIYGRTIRKPVYSYVGVLAASAGYWLAAATDVIVIEETAEAGSIGIRVQATKPPADPNSVEVISRRAPKKSLSPQSDEGRASMQSAADMIETVFVNNVARWRKLTPEQVTAAQGGLLIGRAAVEAKLADRIGSLEQLIAELDRPPVATGTSINANRKGANMKKKTTAGPGACSECTECPAFTPTEGDPEMCTCTHGNAAHAEEAAAATDVTPAAYQAMRAQLAELTKLVKASDERATKAEAIAKDAEAARLATEANAQVDKWEAEGHLTGNATAEVRKLYVAAMTGKSVTAAEIATMVAALPKLDTTRLAQNVKDPAAPTGEAPTKADFLAMARGDKAASAKIDTHVKALVAADKTKSYTAHLEDARSAAK